MIVRRAMIVAGSGIAIGIFAALGLTRLMASLLFDVNPNDAETFAAVAAALTLTALFRGRCRRAKPRVLNRYGRSAMSRHPQRYAGPARGLDAPVAGPAEA